MLRGGDDDSVIDWIANEGIRASYIVAFVRQNGNGSAVEKDFLETSIDTVNEQLSNISTSDTLAGYRSRLIRGGARITVPVSFDVQLSDSVQLTTPVTTQNEPAVEAKKVPYIQPNYNNRKGYDHDFLGIQVDMPLMKSTTHVSKMESGAHVLPYHHFSIVMNKTRRLAYFCASNLDLSLEKRRPEPDKIYNRDALAGLNEGDKEKWLTDPRIPEAHQLPEIFYDKDRQSFDKGHLVRRIDVAWGDNYEEVRSANGDTYHNTNCAPQVADYNRSMSRGVWGLLENHIERQARKERLCVFCGTVFRRNDRWFTGRGERGETKVKIPRSYWKVVVARKEDRLETFAFVLTQSLANVSFEFEAQKWKKSIWPVEKLEEKLKVIKFPDLWKESDQYDRVRNEGRSESLESIEFDSRDFHEPDFDEFDSLGEIEE